MTRDALNNASLLPERVRLYCLPYAGGNASMYNSWQSDLPPQIAVHPIQLPGREQLGHQQPYQQCTPLIEHLLAQVGEPPECPFAFFGHSLGAVLAFELARRLRERYRREPLLLCVSGRQAPHLCDSGPPLNALPTSAFVEQIASRYGELPAILRSDARAMAYFLPLLRADMAVLESYQFTAAAPLDCPICAFGGFADRAISIEGLEAWRLHTRSAFSLRLYPGGHFFINQQQRTLLVAIAEQLQICLQSGGVYARL